MQEVAIRATLYVKLQRNEAEEDAVERAEKILEENKIDIQIYDIETRFV